MNKLTVSQLKSAIISHGLQDLFKSQKGKIVEKGLKSELTDFCTTHNIMPAVEQPAEQPQSQSSPQSQDFIQPKFVAKPPIDKKDDTKNDFVMPDFLKDNAKDYTLKNDENENEEENENSEIKQNEAKMKIQRYYDRFAWLKECKFDCDDEDYCEKLVLVENKLSSYNMSKFISSQFLVVSSVVENLSNKYVPKQYLNLNGFTQNLANNQGLYDVIDEIAIKYSDSPLSVLSPEKRLGLLVLGTAWATTQKNNLAEELTDLKKTKVDDSLLSKNSDL